MIIKTVETNSFTEKKITYQTIDNSRIRLKQVQGQKIYPTRNPLRQIQNQKRFSDYKNQKDNSQTLQTKSEMNQSRLSKLNEDIEQRTKYFAQHGKYDSRWGQQNLNNFNNQRHSQQQKSPNVFRNTYEFREPQYERVKRQQYYRPRAQTEKPYQFITPQYQHYSDGHVCPRMGPLDYHHLNREYTNSHMIDKSDEIRQNFSEVKDLTKYALHEAKEGAMDQARQVKQQIKDNVKQQAKQVVGHQNYQLLSNIGHSVGRLKDNAKQGVKQTFGQVYGAVKQTKDVVVDQAREVKDVAKEGAKETVKNAVGHQNFNLMRYITNLIGQLKRNLFGGQPKPQVSAKYQFKDPKEPKIEQIVQKPKYIYKPESFNEVSPIEYSQRSFSRPPVAELASVWIYTLIPIGIFLVIFQILK